MNIRCACGNEVRLFVDDDESWIDRSWYNEERKAIECPKCGENTLPLPVELADEPVPAQGPVKVVIDVFRPIQLTRKRW